MARPIIISCAVTGGADTKGMNPNVPSTPKEIADEVIEFEVYNKKQKM